jgi:hypothetical protein
MISVQIGATVATALSRLRAFAWSRDRSIDAVARDVVDRRVRFAAEPAGHERGYDDGL